MRKCKTEPPYVGCNLEQEIITKIGNNKKQEKVFKKEIFVEFEGDECEVLSFYTYKHQVCLILGIGWDTNFGGYSDKDKKTLHDAIMQGDYKI